MKSKHVAGGLVAVVALLIILMPRKDICSDTIRGYREDAGAALEAIRSNTESLSASLGGRIIFEVPQIEGLDPASFASLRRCDVQCQILARCLRFVIFSQPSHACPQEYSDLMEAHQRAEVFLADLLRINAETGRIVGNVPALEDAWRNVEELEETMGATGHQLGLARERQHTLETEMVNRIDQVSTELSEVLRRN